MPRTINLHEFESTDNPDFQPAMELANRVRALIATPKARDKQVKIGPSGIGDPCEVCVGNTLALMLPGAKKPRVQKTKLASWIGTACHAHLETLINEMHWEGWTSELKVRCGEIPGYGHVTGHTDGYDFNSATIADWKFVGATTFAKMKKHGMGTKYGVQRNVYGSGVEMLGLPIKTVMNFVVPVGAGLAGVDDILVDIDYYRPEQTAIAFERATILWEDYVLPGHMDELEADPDCFTCFGFGMDI